MIQLRWLVIDAYDRSQDSRPTVNVGIEFKVLQMRQKTSGAVAATVGQDPWGYPVYHPPTSVWSDWQDIPLVVEE